MKSLSLYEIYLLHKETELCGERRGEEVALNVSCSIGFGFKYRRELATLKEDFCSVPCRS